MKCPLFGDVEIVVESDGSYTIVGCDTLNGGFCPRRHTEQGNSHCYFDGSTKVEVSSVFGAGQMLAIAKEWNKDGRAKGKSAVWRHFHPAVRE